MEELYKHTQTKTCPTCRAPLPPGAEKMHEEAVLRYLAVKMRVEREEGLSWSALPRRLQKEMDEVIKLWRRAADMGWARAQYELGCRYRHAEGVKEDREEAHKWYLRAAEQVFFSISLAHEFHALT